MILYTRKVVETAEVRGKGVSGVKGGPKRNQLTLHYLVNGNIYFYIYEKVKWNSASFRGMALVILLHHSLSAAFLVVAKDQRLQKLKVELGWNGAYLASCQLLRP
jgi:hypothetical protein